MLLDKAEPHRDCSAKTPTALFEMSHSIRVQSSSRDSFAISNALSAGDAMIDLGGGAAGFTARKPMSRCQRRSTVGMIPNSPAISACVRPLVSRKANASRLNSGKN